MNAKKCSRCSNLLKDDELYTCKPCLDKIKIRSKTRNERLKAEGICLGCGKNKTNGKIYCEPCRTKRNERQRRIRSELKEMGICPFCTKTPLVGDEKYCIECRSYMAEKNYQRYHANPEVEKKRRNRNAKIRRDERKKQGLCSKCGGEIDDKRYIECSKCRAKYRQAKKSSYASHDRYEKGICRFCDKEIMPGYKVCVDHKASIMRAAQKSVEKRILIAHK